MREIKFRAWDKEYEKMTYFDDEDYEYEPPLVFRLDQVFKKDSNYDDYEDFEYNDITNKVEIMQYVGLKDENDKEIYEGDILKINDDIRRTYDLEYIMYIEFREGAFYLNSEKEKKWTLLRCLPALVDIEGKVRGRVIGNIFEDKELLNETN